MWWSVSLIVSGVLAGSLLLAAVSANLVIAWLIVLAGMVHLIIAHHRHPAGSLTWRLMIGFAYVLFGVCLIACPVLSAASLPLVLALLLLFEGIFEIALFFRLRNRRLKLGSARRGRHPDIGTDDLRAVAVDCCVGDRRLSGRESGHQRPYACDAFSGRPQVHHSGTRANQARRFIREGLLQCARVSRHPSLADLYASLVSSGEPGSFERVETPPRLK
jgi:hypothetical protein